MTKRQDLCLQRRSRPEQSDQRQANQPANISHQTRASPDSTSLASRIEFPTMTVAPERLRREARHFATDFRVISRQRWLLMLDPNSLAGLGACTLSLRVEAQAKRIAVMIPNHPLRLPGGKDSERPQFSDDGFGRAIDTVPHHARCFSDRETIEMV